MQKIKWAIFILVLFCNATQIIAQCKYECLDSASVAYCRGNIREAIAHLEQFIYEFPEDALIEEAQLRVGQLYQEMRNYSRAIEIMQTILRLKDLSREESYKRFEEGFDYNPNFDKIIPPYDEEYKCRQIIKSVGRLKEIKYNACLTLYDIFLHKQNFDSSIYYLNTANKNYFPNTGCGNGDAIRETEIAIKFADAYLLKYDTLNAINHLFKVFFHQEGRICDKARSLLYSLVKAKYTKTKINEFIDQAIANAEIRRVLHHGEAYNQLYFSIMGCEPKLWFRADYRSAEEFRDWLRKNPYLQGLRL